MLGNERYVAVPHNIHAIVDCTTCSAKRKTDARTRCGLRVAFGNVLLWKFYFCKINRSSRHVKKSREFALRLILIINVKPIISVYNHCPCTANKARLLENIFMATIFFKGWTYLVAKCLLQHGHLTCTFVPISFVFAKFKPTFCFSPERTGESTENIMAWLQNSMFSVKTRL